MFEFPEKLRVALVAPAGPVPVEIVAAGKAVLENCGCQVRIMPHVFAGNVPEYLAAADEARAADINRAAADESNDIIWAVRGGYGCSRILKMIDWAGLRQRQIPVAGFSDITALHWAMAKHECPGILAAPMMKFLSENDSELTAGTLLAALGKKPVNIQLEALRPGNVTGKPLPGNLTVAASLCGTPFFPDTSGMIPVLEDVGEAPYRIDRALTQLLLAGAFERCAGVIFGNFTDCGTPDELLEVLTDFTARVKCPVFKGFPLGHELPFYSLASEQMLSVSAGMGSFDRF